MFTVLIFFIVIGVLVLVHEWGHFVMARRAGMKVEEFGFGFPPRIWGFKKGGVLYSINLIPFGGFVKIFGEDGSNREDSGSFGSKSFWPRFNTIIAGVVMNILLAVVLLTLVNFSGLRVAILDENTAAIATDLKVQILEVTPDSPAEKAGLLPLDELEGFSESGNVIIPINKAKDAFSYIEDHSGQNINIIVKRGNKSVILSGIEVRTDASKEDGAVGIAISETGVIKYPWYEAIWRGAYNTVIMTGNTIYGYYLLFSTLITEGELIAEVSGPVGIAKITGQAARVGFNFLAQFVALISINLAILNILPFPALDGGRALLLIIEKIRGVPIKKEIEGALNATGFLLLIGLMIYVTFKDIVKFFG